MSLFLKGEKRRAINVWEKRCNICYTEGTCHARLAGEVQMMQEDMSWSSLEGRTVELDVP